MDTLIRHKKYEGFTLIELMTVVCIMALMMAIGMGAFLDYGRGAGMRGSSLNVHSAINLARQWAITHRVRTTFEYGNMPEGNRGWYVMKTNDAQIGSTNYLADNICFTDTDNECLSDVTGFTFTYDGSVKDELTGIKVVLVEQNRAEPLVQHVEVMPLTGRCRVKDVATDSTGSGTGRGDPGGGGTL